MDRTFWQRQTADKPLFPDLLWSRPETKRTAGKLLIVGGNAHGFSAAAEAYGAAAKAGIGTARVLLPDSLQKTVGKVFAAGEYAPSTPSGSFSQQALAELLELAQWADGVLLAGDFGRNSETAILLESFAAKYQGAGHQLTFHTGIHIINGFFASGRSLARANHYLFIFITCDSRKYHIYICWRAGEHDKTR
jgi:hypothetical protein